MFAKGGMEYAGTYVRRALMRRLNPRPSAESHACVACGYAFCRQMPNRTAGEEGRVTDMEANCAETAVAARRARVHIARRRRARMRALAEAKRSLPRPSKMHCCRSPC